MDPPQEPQANQPQGPQPQVDPPQDPPLNNDGANAAGGNAELVELREKLQLLQQIHNLQNAVGMPHPGHATVPKNVKVPEGRYTMSLSEYRTYSKDCVDYKTLTGLNDNQIVLQMRLNMDNDLKLAIDTNFPDWRTKTVEDAIKNVGEIVNQISNCAVYRKQFHSMMQGESEPIREFCTRLRNCSTDCLSRSHRYVHHRPDPLWYPGHVPATGTPAKTSYPEHPTTHRTVL